MSQTSASIECIEETRTGCHARPTLGMHDDARVEEARRGSLSWMALGAGLHRRDRRYGNAGAGWDPCAARMDVRWDLGQVCDLMNNDFAESNDTELETNQFKKIIGI